MKRALSLLIAGALCLGLCGCQTYDNFYNTFFAPEQEEETLIIGVFEPFTGDDAAAAADEIAGIRMANRLYDHVLGVKVQLLDGDNHSDTGMAAAAAQGLIDQGALVVLGSYKSVLSLAASDVFKENKVPAIGVTCKNPLITQTNEYYFRVCYIDAYEGKCAANYVVEGLGEDSAVILRTEGDDYAQALADRFKETMISLTGSEDSITEISFSQDEEDLGRIFEVIDGSGIQTVFFPSSAQLGDRVICEAYESGYNFDWVGDSQWNGIDGVNPDYKTNGKSYLTGVSYTEDYDVSAYSSAMTQLMLNEYAKENGSGAVPSEAFAFGFDAYLLALAGIEEAGSTTDSELIARKLTSVYELEGATGKISLNSQGDPIRDVIIEQVTPDGVHAVYTVAPKWGE